LFDFKTGEFLSDFDEMFTNKACLDVVLHCDFSIALLYKDFRRSHVKHKTKFWTSGRQYNESTFEDIRCGINVHETTVRIKKENTKISYREGLIGTELGLMQSVK
jgi:hypothetical protein